MLIMNYFPLAQYFTDARRLQTSSSKEGALHKDEERHGSATLALTKNQLRSRAVQHLRSNRSPYGNCSGGFPNDLLASCLSKQSLNCMICLELLLQPVALSCGHSFCRPCIENLNQASNQNRCSLCRSDDALPFYEPDRTTSKIMEIIRRMDMTPLEKREYKRRQRTLRRELAKRGAECSIRAHDQIKVRVKNRWVKARVISIVETKENTYYQVQTNTQERYMINCRSKNILAKQEDLARSREMTTFLENANSVQPQPFREITNSYDIEDLLEVDSCPSQPQSLILQSHSSLFFDLQLYPFDGLSHSFSGVIS